MTQGQLFDHYYGSQNEKPHYYMRPVPGLGSDPRGRGTVSCQEVNILLRTDR